MTLQEPTVLTVQAISGLRFFLPDANASARTVKGKIELELVRIFSSIYEFIGITLEVDSIEYFNFTIKSETTLHTTYSVEMIHAYNLLQCLCASFRLEPCDGNI